MKPLDHPFLEGHLVEKASSHRVEAAAAEEEQVVHLIQEEVEAEEEEQVVRLTLGVVEEGEEVLLVRKLYL